MTQKEIQDILKLRIAVYKAGIRAGEWTDLDQSGASDLMLYLFPKSGNIAMYNLIIEQMRIEHSMFKGGTYSLFKMPVNIEKEIVEYLKISNCDINNLIQDYDQYLEEMDIIATDHNFFNVNIGLLNNTNIDTILRLCASHYRYSFLNKVKSYPYFE